MDTHDRIARADEHIFSTGLADSGALVAQANLRYGLAKVHLVQEALGLAPDATFVAAPDFTVTRDRTRWRSGFGYGGAVTWGDGNAELVILDLKPNACGIIVGGLHELPDKHEVMCRVHELARRAVEIRGIPVTWDLGKSNHFIDVCRVVTSAGERLPPFVFLMHFAGDEMRGDGPHGPGIYWDRSATLRARMRVFQTPFGCLRALVGADAVAYLRHYREVEAFSKERRAYAASALFGDYELLNNETHQGLVGMNRMVLGCYSFDDSDCVYPLGLRPDLPAYLVRGRRNLSRKTMERLGLDRRARRHGVTSQVEGADVLPHGGGYVFPDIADVAHVHEVDGARYFELQPKCGVGSQIVEDLRDLPYEYRDRRVLDRALDLDLLEVAACLVPEYVLKV